MSVECDHGPWEGWDDECAANHVDDHLGAIRWELSCLWSDLADAYRNRITNKFTRDALSIRCESVIDRIVRLSRFVGALPWDHVSPTLIRVGLYERVHRDAGIEFGPIDWRRLERAEVTTAARLAALTALR